jgi:hypothetical protein
LQWPGCAALREHSGLRWHCTVLLSTAAGIAARLQWFYRREEQLLCDTSGPRTERNCLMALVI